MPSQTSATLSKNLRMLMLDQGVKYSDFDKRNLGITGRHLRRVIQDEQTLSLDKLDILARVFGVRPCDLINPAMRLDGIDNGELQALIDAYTSADSESRQFIAQVVERETSR